MICATLRVTLSLESPILTRESGPANFGFDAAMARDAEGCFILPRTLVKGRLREALAELIDAAPGRFTCDVNELFGDDTGHAVDGEGVNNAPHRGRLELTDFKCTPEPEAAGAAARHRIRMDRNLGSAAKGALLVMENPFGSGASVAFEGILTFPAHSAKGAEDLAWQLERGLRWMTQLGAGRTVGFGRLRGVTVRLELGTKETSAGPVRNSGPETLALSIRPRAPFCFSKHKIGGNLFESFGYLPGNGLKGSMAETWAALLGKRLGADGVRGLQDATRVELTRHFDSIRFRHAFPSAGDQRAQVAPLSIVAVGGELRDVVAQPHAVVLRITGDQGCPEWRAPEFRIDWKGETYEKCDAALGWGKTNRELRVRTAMDSRNRKSANSKLFAQELVVPGEVVWRGVIDLSAVPPSERTAVSAQLRSLLAFGLHYLGKTKTAADVDISDVTAPGSVPPPINGTYRLTLQTPALLCDPRFQPGVHTRTGPITREVLHGLYRSVWDELSGGTLKLSHFFASQSLAGGNYLYKRFQAVTGKPYRPWLLTDAGSVFVLTVSEDKGKQACANERLTEWLHTGLPLPAWARNAFGEDWTTNPYLPANGFGEIALNITGTGIPEPAAMEIAQCRD